MIGLLTMTLSMCLLTLEIFNLNPGNTITSIALPSSAAGMGGDLHDYAVRPRSENLPNPRKSVQARDLSKSVKSRELYKSVSFHKLYESVQV